MKKRMQGWKKELCAIFIYTCSVVSSLQAEQNAEEAFTNIYQHRVWGTNSEGEGTSGGGSSLESTQLYREFLQNFLNDYNIQSVVDVGCGDWGFSHAIKWDGIDYKGYDVVQIVIDNNIRKFESPNIHFFQGNALTTDLPAADLLICKDVLQHLSNADVLNFFNQLHKFKYCLITNDVDPYTLTSSNPDIQRAGYRFIDLTQPPFNVLATKVFNYMSQGWHMKQVLLISSFESE